jgi:hypothetical protein
MSSNKRIPENLENLFTESYTTTLYSHNKDGTIHAEIRFEPEIGHDDFLKWI